MLRQKQLINLTKLGSTIWNNWSEEDLNAILSHFILLLRGKAKLSYLEGIFRYKLFII
jgi:hypothetical protein